MYGLAKQKTIIYNGVRDNALHLKWKRELSFKELIDYCNILIEENKILESDLNSSRIIITGLKNQNQRYKQRLLDLGVEYL